MKNFKVIDKDTNKEYWISRSSAVVGIVYAKIPRSIYLRFLSISSFSDIKKIFTKGFKDDYVFLISKRGPGCPDFVGSWAFTCGYLDWDETKKEAVVRELWEELGLKESIIKNITKFCEIDDPKRDSRQNLVTRYLVEVNFEDLYRDFVINKNSTMSDTSSRGGEKGEVSDIKLILESEMDQYKNWAFNHDMVLKEVITYLKTGQKPYYCND